MQNGGNKTQIDDILSHLEALDPGVTQQGNSNQFYQEFKRKKARTLPTLLDHLLDSNPNIRMDAAELIGELKEQGRPALHRLKSLADNDPDHAVRQTAAVALIQVGGDVLLGEVVKHLNDPDPEIVSHAAVTLGKVGDKRVVPNLLKAFQTNDELVGSAIAWALGRLQDPRAIDWLAVALEHGFVAANAAEALGRIGDPKALPVLMHCLNNPNEDARSYAARALGMIKPLECNGIQVKKWIQEKEKIIHALQHIVANDPSKKVRVFASIALYELGDTKTSKTFVSLLQDHPSN